MATFVSMLLKKPNEPDHGRFMSDDKFSRLKTDGLLAYQINEVCHLVGISRSTLYELVNEGKLRTVMIRGRRLVPRSEVQNLLDGGEA